MYLGGEPLESCDGESFEGADPYGETRLTIGTIYTDKLFSGQRDTGLGIYDFKVRMYDPKIGRFLSADTIVPGAGNPQAYNRYSYTLGNPLRYTDPTGHMQVDDPYTKNDGKCSAGDTSCNWVGKSPKKLKKDTDKNNGDILGQCDSPHCTDERKYIHFRDDEYPDYITANVATGWPFGIVGIDIQVTRDYYNNWYVAPGVYIGTPGVSVFGGYILQDTRSKQDLENFITSSSVFGGGGVGMGGGATWGHPFDGELNWNDFAGEAGLTSPGGAAGWTYGIPVSNIGNFINNLIRVP